MTRALTAGGVLALAAGAIVLAQPTFRVHR